MPQPSSQLTPYESAVKQRLFAEATLAILTLNQLRKQYPSSSHAANFGAGGQPTTAWIDDYTSDRQLTEVSEASNLQDNSSGQQERGLPHLEHDLADIPKGQRADLRKLRLANQITEGTPTTTIDPVLKEVELASDLIRLCCNIPDYARSDFKGILARFDELQSGQHDTDSNWLILRDHSRIALRDLSVLAGCLDEITEAAARKPHLYPWSPACEEILVTSSCQTETAVSAIEQDSPFQDRASIASFDATERGTGATLSDLLTRTRSTGSLASVGGGIWSALFVRRRRAY